MGRAKISMEFINDSKKRDSTFKKRKNGIIKKGSELSSLCDVFVLMIIFSDHQETPQIFPPDTDKFNSFIEHYIKTRATDHAKIKSYDLFEFFKDRKNKIEEQLYKTKKKNLQAKYPTWFDFLNDVPEGKLREFAYVLGSKIDNVKVRIESLKKASYIQNLDQGCQQNVLNYVNPITMMTPSMDYNKAGFYPMEYLYGDQNQNNMIMQLQSSNPNLAMKMPMSDQDYYNYCDPIKTMMQIGYNDNLGAFDRMELCRNDKTNLIMQSPHPNDVNRNSFMKIMSTEDDRYYCYDDFGLQNLLRAEDNALARPDGIRHTQELIRDGVFNLI